MQYYHESAEKAYEKRQENIIIALTGRTGSGCTTLSKILRKETFDKLSLHNPKTYDFSSRDERKYEIVYKFIKENGHWEPFTTIEVSSILLSFVIQYGFDSFKEYIKSYKYTNKDNNIRIFNFEEFYNSLNNLSYLFEQNNFFNFDKTKDPNGDSEEIKGYYDFYINKLPQLKREFYNTIKEATCYSNNNDKFSSEELQKYNFYTYFMQQIGNNIRCSGHPYKNEYKQNFYLVAERIDSVIKIIEKYNVAQNKKNNRICIDAIRNPYEAYYFKDRYSYFYLVSVNAEEADRKVRLGNLDEEELKSLDLIEYDEPGKEPYSIFYHQNILECLSISDIHLYNPQCADKKFSFLTEQIVKYICLMLHPGLVCPTHIERCMQLAYSAKLNSGCLSRQVGAVITGEDFSIKAVGWNDVPEGQIPCNLRCIEDYCLNRDPKTYSSYELEEIKFQKVLTSMNSEIDKNKLLGMSYSYCFKDLYNEITHKKNQVHTRALHAEENAFLQLSKNGGQGIKGGKLFTTASPCELCAKKAFQLGIKEIYYIDPYPGISIKHILSCGMKPGPKMNLFFGAIGNAYIKLYTPRIPLKDELKLRNEIKVGEAIKKSENRNYVKPGIKDIKYINIESSFIFKSRTDIVLKNKYTIEALHDNISKFIEEIFWTGSFLSEFRVLYSDRAYSIKDLNCPNSPYAFEIELAQPLKKGEQVTFEYEVSAKDPNKTMYPLYIQAIPIKTDYLKITVNAKNGALENVKAIPFAGLETTDEQRLDSEIIKTQVDGSQTLYIYEKNFPYLNYSYGIEWNFKNGFN